MAASLPSVQFVDRHRATLIQRVCLVESIADALLSQGLIHSEMYSDLRAARTSQEKMRELYEALHCGGAQVKAAFYSILKEQDPHLVKDLGGSDCCEEEEIIKLRLKYKEWIRREYKTVQEYNSLPGEDVRLDERYTELLMIQKHRQHKQREEELRCTGDSFRKIMNMRNCDEFMSTDVEQLFDPDKDGEVQRTVILQGQAGIGKSFTAQKIMWDWASGKLYSERFDYIFHLKCRELNLISEKISVVDLILNSSPHLMPAIAQVLSRPEEILFIIDGFDELRFPVVMSEFARSHDPHEQNCPEVTLSRLMRKVILPECYLLITTRSTALDKLTQLLKQQQPRYIEILGFSEKGMKEYFQKFFKDEQKAMCAFNYVENNEIVFTTCFIPVICWIVCTVLREQFEEGTDITHALSTPTTIFVYFVDALLEHHCRSLSLPVQEVLRRLGMLAESGIKEQRVLFEDKRVQDIFPDLSEVPSSFLNKVLLRKSISRETMYSFMHISFQEFCAALSYVLCDDQEAKTKVTKLLKQTGKHDKNHLLMTVQFLFGLSNKETTDFLKKKYKHSISSEVRPLLESWIQELITQKHNFHIKIINILHFVYELHENDFLKHAMNNLTDIDLSYNALKRTDCVVVTYCLQACRHIESLTLLHCNLKSQELEILLPVFEKCRFLVLDSSSLGDCEVNTLSKALSPSCKTEELVLDVRRLSDEKMEDLFSALCSLQRLTEVTLSFHSFTESCASLLVNLIMSCTRLQRLRIDGTHENQCMADLSARLIRPHQSQEAVQLESIDLRNKAMIHLCESLREKGVAIKDVWLILIGITDACIDDLCSSRSLHQSMKHLVLYDSEFTEASIPALICFIEKCNNLENLQLDVCRLSDEKMEDLFSALCSLQRLSEVILTLNSLSERRASILINFIMSCTRLQRLRLKCTHLSIKAVTLLYESLRETGVTIEDVTLIQTDNTDACIDDLCPSHSLQRSMKYLDLRVIVFTFASIPALRVLFRNAITLKT
ncbi:NACHT, LRR and PYD domains-containing protein 3 [Amia ocellicauda]|uniref:NACHT, LRR and PYD domains-containing protein 3 n=1 Tax=Amia ocellicauda TaxID=2972642 RepID=UPI003464B63E